MPNNLYFDTPFATSGDKTSVPDSLQPSGVVSYTQGYSISYSTPVADGGYDFPRGQHNQILYDITIALQDLQQHGAPRFITTAMNGGITPFSYILGAIVAYDAGGGNQVWVSTAASNTTTPGAGGAHWAALTASSSPLFIGGTTTGSANVQAVTTNQASFANTAGNIVTAKAGISVTGTATLSVDSVSNIPIKVATPSGLRNTLQGDIVSTCEYMFISDGTNLQLLNPSAGNTRTKLGADTTFYVTTSGNDSTGNGTIGSPWATMQHANDYIVANIDIAGFQCFVSVGNGTFTAGLSVTVPPIGGAIQFVGNTTTPASCIISTTGDCFASNNGVTLNMGGFKCVSSGGYGIHASSNSIVNVNNKMEYGACVDHIVPSDGSIVNIFADYTISGGGNAHISCLNNAAVNCTQTITVTLSGTPAFSVSYGFIYASIGCTVNYYQATFAGTGATGPRYNSNANSVIFTNGGGASYFPGNSAGSVATGGVYL